MTELRAQPPGWFLCHKVPGNTEVCFYAPSVELVEGQKGGTMLAYNLAGEIWNYKVSEPIEDVMRLMGEAMEELYQEVVVAELEDEEYRGG